METPRRVIGFFGYAAIGVVAGFAFLAFPDLESRLAAVLACGVTAAIARYFLGRADTPSNRLLDTEPDGDDGVYGKFLQERWNEDVVLPSSVTGVRGLPASLDNWGAPEVDSRGGSADDFNRV